LKNLKILDPFRLTPDQLEEANKLFASTNNNLSLKSSFTPRLATRVSQLFNRPGAGDLLSPLIEDGDCYYDLKDKVTVEELAPEIFKYLRNLDNIDD
jgi:hypothetical protein